jgi:hypothetical protein
MAQRAGPLPSGRCSGLTPPTCSLSCTSLAATARLGSSLGSSRDAPCSSHGGGGFLAWRALPRARATAGGGLATTSTTPDTSSAMPAALPSAGSCRSRSAGEGHQQALPTAIDCSGPCVARTTPRQPRAAQAGQDSAGQAGTSPTLASMMRRSLQPAHEIDEAWTFTPALPTTWRMNDGPHLRAAVSAQPSAAGRARGVRWRGAAVRPSAHLKISRATASRSTRLQVSSSIFSRCSGLPWCCRRTVPEGRPVGV